MPAAMDYITPELGSVHGLTAPRPRERALCAGAGGLWDLARFTADGGATNFARRRRQNGMRHGHIFTLATMGCIIPELDSVHILAALHLRERARREGPHGFGDLTGFTPDSDATNFAPRRQTELEPAASQC